jgi:hypothetical protein
MVLAALANGKHVYNASPHAPDWAGREGDRRGLARGRQRRRGRRLLRMDPRPSPDEGDGGRGLSRVGRWAGPAISASRCSTSPIKQFPYNWFAQAGQGVSAVRNNGSHALYMLLHLFGPIEELVADDTQVLREWVFPDGDKIVPETNDLANVILRSPAG